MNHFKVPRDWEGQTAVILASGPSMTRDVAEVVRRSGLRTIAVNNCGINSRDANGTRYAAMAPWADILYAADKMWWANNLEEALAFKGLKITVAPSNGTHQKIDDSVLSCGHGGIHGVDDRQTHIRTGHNSGYQAVHLAYNFGARRILLCGFDMHGRDGEHWHGDHHWRRGFKSQYVLFRASFKRAAPEYAKRGIEIINCTPGSALKCFPFEDLEAVIERVQALRYMPENSGLAPSASQNISAAHGNEASAA